MASALPSNALYDVQKYLRQKRATGAQVNPQDERAAWSGYFDTMERNSLGERDYALRAQRLNMDEEARKDVQKASEGAATMSGIGQLVSTVGQGGMLLKGTDLGSKIGLGASTATPTPTTTGAAPVAASGVVGGGTTTAGVGGSAAGLAGPESTAIAGGGSGGAVAAGGGGLLDAAAPYTGPAGVGLAAGSVVPKLLGIENEAGKMAAGTASGAVAGAVAGTYVFPGVGTAVGGVIGAVAGAVGAKIK
jgi:hypothetical protein